MWPILAFGCQAVEVESGFGLGGRLLEWRFQIGGLSAEIKLVCRWRLGALGVWLGGLVGLRLFGLIVLIPIL